MRTNDKKDFKWLPNEVAQQVREKLGSPQFWKGDFVISLEDEKEYEVLEDDCGDGYVKVRGKGGMPLSLLASEVKSLDSLEVA